MGAGATAGTSFAGILGAVYGLLFPIGIGVGVVFIIIAAYKFIVSEGNPQKVSEAKEDLTAAIIGIVFIMLSLVLLRIIMNNILGVTI